MPGIGLEVEPHRTEAQIRQVTFLPLDTHTVGKVVDDQVSSVGDSRVEPGLFEADSLDIKVRTDTVEPVSDLLGSRY